MGGIFREEDLRNILDDEVIEKLVRPLNKELDKQDRSIRSTKLQNVDIVEVSVVGGGFPWISPTLSNGWSNFGAPYEPIGYQIDHLGRVRLRGLIAGGTLNTAAFVLPQGYRPSNQRTWIAITNDVWGRTDIDTSGNVVIALNGIGSNVWYSLDLVEFEADSPAKPEPYSGKDWPIRIKHNLRGKIIGVVPISCKVVRGTPDDTALVPRIQWKDTGDGSLNIVSADGLVEGTKYSMRFLIIGE